MTNYIERYWRDATPIDAIKKPPMLARFRDGNEFDWHIDYLAGVRSNHDYPWFSFKLNSHKHCQVYNAPDPGEDWRLVDVDTEQPIVGDEIYDKPNNRWLFRSHDKPYDKELIYRRRIEPPKPKYIPFTWEDREQLRGRWIGSNDGRCQRSINTMHNDNGIFYLCAINAESLCTDWHFIDTREPVGKRVQ